MTATTAGRELDFPKLPLRHFASAIRFAALLLPCLLASLIAGAARPGSVIALFFVPPLALVLRELWPRRRETRVQFQIAMAAGALAGVALEPGWLNLTMGWLLLLALAIEARSDGTHAALQGLRAVGWAVAASPFGIVIASMAAALHVPLKMQHVSRIPFTSLVLPVLAVLVFVPLLAAGNPLFEQLLLSFDVGNPFVWLERLAGHVFTFETFIFLLALLMLWPVLHGKNTARAIAPEAAAATPLWHATFFKPFAVAATLMLLNLLFAIENGLDVQHLWLNPVAPGSYNHADYVHRGAYTLIFTAALAGVLMVTALRKGTATESSSLVRRLVYVFAAQNLLLVASSVQRTLLYIDAYGWTEWRVSGLAWMALVFFGLATIFWRVAKSRDSRWLFNTNILAAMVVLVGFCMWDMQGFVAGKNVNRALAQTVATLDTQYFAELSLNALPALRRYDAELVARQHVHTNDGVNDHLNFEKSRVRSLAGTLASELILNQRDWRSWTWRHAN